MPEVPAATCASRRLLPDLGRRDLFVVGATGAGLVLLAACGSSTAPTAGATSGSGSGGASGTTLIKIADIEVGQSAAATLDGQPVLVTRTGESTAVAFSAICTHMGCQVEPAGAELHCPCHGSKYTAATGAVIAGPAPKPLPAVKVTVAGGAVVTA